MSFQDEYEKERELHKQRWEMKKKKEKNLRGGHRKPEQREGDKTRNSKTD